MGIRSSGSDQIDIDQSRISPRSDQSIFNSLRSDQIDQIGSEDGWFTWRLVGGSLRLWLALYATAAILEPASSARSISFDTCLLKYRGSKILDEPQARSLAALTPVGVAPGRAAAALGSVMAKPCGGLGIGEANIRGGVSPDSERKNIKERLNNSWPDAKALSTISNLIDRLCSLPNGTPYRLFQNVSENTQALSGN